MCAMPETTGKSTTHFEEKFSLFVSQCAFSDPLSRCVWCVNTFSPCGPKFTSHESKQNNKAALEQSFRGATLGSDPDPDPPPSDDTSKPRQHSGDRNGQINFEPLISSEEAKFLLKAKLVGSLARRFPELGKELLWDSIGQALEGLRGCEGGDVEKLGMVSFLFHERNSFPISPSMSVLSTDSTVA